MLEIMRENLRNKLKNCHKKSQSTAFS